MNIPFLLEYLGFDNGVDFEYRKSTGLVWMNEQVPEPLETTLEAEWAVYIADEEPVLLEEDRAAALKRADAHSGRKRSQYIAGGIGQDLVYQEKATQAQEFKDGGYVNPENYPFIDEEATALGKTPTEVADAILANRAAWIALGAQIESLRLAAKEEIRNCSDRTLLGGIIDNLVSDFDDIP